MHLAVSLFLGLLYVSSFNAASAAEYLPQFDILTKQRPIEPSQQHSYRLDEITIDQLHGLFDNGSLTSEILVHARASLCLTLRQLLICKGLHQAGSGSE